MANYTKQEMRKRELAKHFAEMALKPKPRLSVCSCGAPAVVEFNRPPHTWFFCTNHGNDAEAAFSRSLPQSGQDESSWPKESISKGLPGRYVGRPSPGGT